MHTLTLNIKNSAYNSISYFLTNLSSDVEILNHNINNDSISLKNGSLNLRGVFNKYADSNKIKQENNIWKNHIAAQYKKDN
jgi:hypothetical protein